MTRAAQMAAYRLTLNGVMYDKLRACRRSAEKRGVPYSLTVAYLVSVYEKQKGLCALTGRVLPVGRGQNDWGSLSVDRVTPALGYVEGNVRLAILAANVAKGPGTDDDLVRLARDIIATIGREHG